MFVVTIGKNILVFFGNLLKSFLFFMYKIIYRKTTCYQMLICSKEILLLSLEPFKTPIKRCTEKWSFSCLYKFVFYKFTNLSYKNLFINLQKMKPMVLQYFMSQRPHCIIKSLSAERSCLKKLLLSLKTVF